MSGVVVPDVAFPDIGVVAFGELHESCVVNGLYDWWTDQRIGAPTEDQIALSDESDRRGDNGLIHIDARGRVTAFGIGVAPPRMCGPCSLNPSRCPAFGARYD